VWEEGTGSREREKERGGEGVYRGGGLMVELRGCWGETEKEGHQGEQTETHLEHTETATDGTEKRHART
jgi:hypothetical protein